MRLHRLLLGLIGFLLLAAPASAQPPTSYILKIFNQGATAPVTTTTIPASSFTCGQTPKVTVSTGTETNPNRLAFDDPANPSTADCVYVDPGTGPILSLPFGAQVYTAVMDVVNAVGTTADSASSNPFVHPGTISAVVTGLRVK